MADLATADPFAVAPNNIVTRNVMKHGFPGPVQFQFDPTTPAEQQDSYIRSHFAEMQAQRDYPQMGAQGALGRLLVSAQQAVPQREAMPEEAGPKVIRASSAWGLTPGQITDSFTALSQRQSKQQEMEMQRQENLARRQQALAEMQQQLDLAAQEHQLTLKVKGMEHSQRLDEIAKTNELTLKVKGMEHSQRLDEIAKTNELTSVREKAKDDARMEREKYKAENKAPKLTEAYDAATGMYTLQPEKEGLITKGPKTEEEINAKSFEYANHLMSYEFVDQATGKSEPMDFKTASTIAHELAKGNAVHLDNAGMQLVRRSTQDLTPVTDPEGKTTLQPKTPGLQTKPAPQPKSSETRADLRTMWEVDKANVKDAQQALDMMTTEPTAPDYDAEALKKAKKELADAKTQEAETRKLLRGHLQPSSSAQPTEQPSGPAPGQAVDDLAGVPDGTPITEAETGRKGIVRGGQFVPYTPAKE